MTKNNFFKKQIREYAKDLDMSYMQALNIAEKDTIHYLAAMKTIKEIPHNLKDISFYLNNEQVSSIMSASKVHVMHGLMSIPTLRMMITIGRYFQDSGLKVAVISDDFDASAWRESIDKAVVFSNLEVDKLIASMSDFDFVIIDDLVPLSLFKKLSDCGINVLTSVYIFPLKANITEAFKDIDLVNFRVVKQHQSQNVECFFERVSSKVMNEIVKLLPRLNHILTPDQISFIDQSQINIIHGAAGSGKTVFMQSLYWHVSSTGGNGLKRTIVFTNADEAIIWKSSCNKAVVVANPYEISVEHMAMMSSRMRAEVIILDGIEINTDNLKSLENCGLKTFISVDSSNSKELIGKFKNSKVSLTHIELNEESGDRKYSVTEG